MRGTIIYVNRIPLGLRSIECRKTPKTSWLDMLIIRCLSYKHYGVDLGDGTVVHFRCESILAMKEAKVMITSLEDFSRDGLIQIESSIVPVFTPDQIVERAFSRLEPGFDVYHPKYNNCEHFCTWCATGTRSSQQDLIRDARNQLFLLPVRTKERLVAAMAFLSFFS